MANTKRTFIYCALAIIALGILSCKKPISVPIGSITGASAICLGEENVQYTVTAESATDHYILWSVPEGAEIISGQGTTSIIVNFGKHHGSICAVLYKDGEAVSVKSCLEVKFGVSDKWCREVDFPNGKRSGAIAFSIGNKGYVGTGFDNASEKHQDLWEYDPETVAWTQKKSFPGTARLAALAFVIGNKGYVGMGYKGFGSAQDNFFNDLWEYDPLTNNWLEKSSLPGPARQYAIGFSVNNKGYVGCGQPGLSSLLSDFYEYDPIQDQWTQKSDMPYPRLSAIAFSIGSKGYVGTGQNAGATTFYNDFYEYNPVTDQWLQKSSFPGASRFGALGFVIGNKGYLGTGFNAGAVYKDFWEYDPLSDTWLALPDLETARGFAVGFAIGNKGYVGIGNYTSSGIFEDFWVYTQ